MCAAAWIFGLQPVNFAPHWGTKWPGEPARNDMDTLWTILHAGSTKTYMISNYFKAEKLSSERGIDTRNREQFRDFSWNMWKSSFRASTNSLPQPFPVSPPRKADLGSHTAAAVVVVAKVHFWLSTSHGLSQNILLHLLKALEHLVNAGSSFPQWRSRKWL